MGWWLSLWCSATCTWGICGGQKNHRPEKPRKALQVGVEHGRDWRVGPGLGRVGPAGLYPTCKNRLKDQGDMGPGV